jgi:tRNA modification GTPase
VVVAGPPNVGKSSLINILSGEDRSIVTDVPGTTRDHIEVPLSVGGVPVRLIDTAGLRNTEDQVESIGVARAGKLIEAADVLVWLGEEAVAPRHRQIVMVHAKVDLPERRPPPPGSLGVSSVTGEGVAGLLEIIESRARAILPSDDAIALNRRQARHIEEAADSLSAAASGSDPVLVAEDLRMARGAFDRLTGRAGVEDVLDALFGRFCLGK